MFSSFFSYFKNVVQYVSNYLSKPELFYFELNFESYPTGYIDSFFLDLSNSSENILYEHLVNDINISQVLLYEYATILTVFWLFID
ncbi:MAG: hypothetical protein CO189_10945, partial [candidate division Zixibacteria bacterium CG_4_9_14_3_um_filter_46_8]